MKLIAFVLISSIGSLFVLHILTMVWRENGYAGLKGGGYKFPAQPLVYSLKGQTNMKPA